MSEPKIQTLVGIPPKERARLQDIEAKAIALLREVYGDDEMTVAVDDETYTTVKGVLAEGLRKAIGITVEELRGEQ